MMGIRGERNRQLQHQIPKDIAKDVPGGKDNDGSMLEVFGFEDLSPDAKHRVQELQVLVAFYDTTGGTNWDVSKGWLKDGSSPCEWQGVLCNNDQLVTALDLPNNNLAGTLAASMLWDMPYLSYVDVSQNPLLTVDFSSQVSLTLVSNATVTPSSAMPLVVITTENNISVGNNNATLSKEGFFLEKGSDINNNSNNSSNVTIAPIYHLNISGTATGNLHGLAFINRTLKELDISQTAIVSIGSKLPETLVELTELRHLSMNHLALTRGGLDKYILVDTFSNLQAWHASNSSFVGTIPTNIGLLQALETLDWSNNQLRGPLLPLDSLPLLRHVNLSHNRLAGSIPTNLLGGLDNKTLPVYLHLQSNQLEGPVPETLGRLDALTMDVTDNLVTKLPDAFCNKDQWMQGAVGLFGCDAILCQPGQFNEYGRRIDKDRPCKPCDFLGDALFWGSTTCEEDVSPLILGALEENATLAQTLSEYDILTEFYAATGGSDWAANDGWEMPSSEQEQQEEEKVRQPRVCAWHGVQCDNRRSVRALVLPNNNLQGTSTANLLRLPSLRQLQLSDNPRLMMDLTGLSELTETPALEELIVFNTSTSSVEGLSGATNLLSLLINGTRLSRDSLSELYALTNLQTLNIAGNKLEQGLSEEIGALTNLVSLRADGSELSGTIPTQIGLLTNLVALDLSENLFEGPMPLEINQLQQLRIFDLHGQVMPFGGPLLALDGLSSLLLLDLSSNALTGSIPSTFLSGIADNFRVIHVNLKDNQITGNIPLELALFQNMNLDVTENRIEHIPEVLCIKEDWMEGLVSVYGCDAILCPPGTFNEEGRMVAQDRPCQKCSNISLDYFGAVECHNGGMGGIGGMGGTNSSEALTPLAPGRNVALTERFILERLYETTGGNTSWVRTDNWMASETDICEWYGVGCSDDLRVSSLVLAANGLQGKTPPQLFQLSRLERLFLNSNPHLDVDVSWIGSFQAESTFLEGQFGHESVLRALVISGTATTSVSGISKASSLQALNLNSTKIGGEALDELMTLRSLQSLNIGNTRINRRLPNTIGDLTNILELSAPNAGITGTMPDALGRLTGLALLDLSGNSMVGTLPSSLESLMDIRVLDLHDQDVANGGGLEGHVLPFENLFSLSMMDLSMNHLSGQLPETFLSGIFDKSAAVEVNLRSNMLTGSVPETLSNFAELAIDITGNQIMALPESLCSQELWMDGNTQNFGCDAILCPPSTYNSHGREVSASEPCEPCAVEPTPFYGSHTCLNSSELVTATSVCPNGLACYNHGECVESTVEPGLYNCDCSVTNQFGIPFEGMACEYKATDICHTSGFLSTNVTSFCTNNGVCNQRVPPGEEHTGCICDAELWQGDYCQLRNGFGTPTGPMIPVSNVTEQCPDGKVCEHGSHCSANPDEPASYVCNCGLASPDQIPYAGDRCQFMASSLCSVTTPYSSFCVNGGACGALVESGDGHIDCLCPDGFSGSHCEVERHSTIESQRVVGDDDGGMQGWQMALAFVLPGLAILAIFVMILMAYSKMGKKDRQSVNADLLAESEYNRYTSSTHETPGHSGKDEEATDFETPPSIIERALASVPNEEQTGLFSMPVRPKEIQFLEDEPNDHVFEEVDEINQPDLNQDEEQVEFSTLSTSKSSGSDGDAMPEGSVSVLDELPAVEEEHDSEVEREEKDLDAPSRQPASNESDGATPNEETTNIEIPAECPSPDAVPADPEEGVSDESKADSERRLPVNDAASVAASSERAPSVASSDEFHDAWANKPRVAFNLPSDDDSNYIGDIEDATETPSPPAATGKSLFSGIQCDDSVSFLDHSVGMSDDSERSNTPSPFEHTFEVSLEPSLAQTMFAGRESLSETSSGELSLNF